MENLDKLIDGINQNFCTNLIMPEKIRTKSQAMKCLDEMKDITIYFMKNFDKIIQQTGKNNAAMILKELCGIGNIYMENF